MQLTSAVQESFYYTEKKEAVKAENFNQLIPIKAHPYSELQ